MGLIVPRVAANKSCPTLVALPLLSSLSCIDMESAGHENANARLGSTRGESAPQGHSTMISLALHAFMISLKGLFGVYHQLKLPNVSTYKTAFGNVMMNLNIIGTCFYIGFLVAMGILAARNNTDFEDLMNNISLLLGSLSLILELIVLIPPFGWIALFVWSICLLCFLSKSCRSLNTLYQSAVAHLVQDFGELKQKLVDLNRRLMDSNAIAALHGLYQTLTDQIFRNDARMTEHEAQNHSSEVPVSIL